MQIVSRWVALSAVTVAMTGCGGSGGNATDDQAQTLMNTSPAAALAHEPAEVVSRKADLSAVDIDQRVEGWAEDTLKLYQTLSLVDANLDDFARYGAEGCENPEGDLTVSARTGFVRVTYDQCEVFVGGPIRKTLKLSGYLERKEEDRGSGASVDRYALIFKADLTGVEAASQSPVAFAADLTTTIEQTDRDGVLNVWVSAPRLELLEDGDYTALSSYQTHVNYTGASASLSASGHVTSSRLGGYLVMQTPETLRMRESVVCLSEGVISLTGEQKLTLRFGGSTGTSDLIVAELDNQRLYASSTCEFMDGLMLIPNG